MTSRRALEREWLTQHETLDFRNWLVQQVAKLREERDALTNALTKQRDYEWARRKDARAKYYETLERAERAEAALAEARNTLTSLRNEVLAMLGIAPEEIRAAVGNTNLRALQVRLDEAAALLALKEKL